MGSSKSKVKIVNFPDDILEQLRCSVCKGHLSCAPIRLLPDGRSVCGRCLLTDHTAPVYRDLALEIALSRTAFPCRYKQYGCPSKLRFGHTVDHEAKCIYQPFPCPSFPFATCTWQGSVLQVYDHFCTTHPFLFTFSPKFKLDISKDAAGILVTVNNFNTAFLINYKYNSATTELLYDVRYFLPYVIHANYKMQLINNLNPDNNINLNEKKCLPYNSVAQAHSPSMITVSKFLDALDNPKELTIEFKLPTNQHNHKVAKTRNSVNYEVLETLRCAECQNYLALPIFDAPKGPVCADCSGNYLPSKNNELQQLIMITNYPCQWNNCKFIGKGNSIRMHQIVCPHQPYKCPSRDCQVTLTAAESLTAELHLMFCHAYHYFSSRTVYTVPFSISNERTMVSITKNNEVVAIKHQLDHSNAKHIFSLQSCKAGLVDGYANVHFEHSHCKLKSKRFYLDRNQELHVSNEMLPKCFRAQKKVSKCRQPKCKKCLKCNRGLVSCEKILLTLEK